MESCYEIIPLLERYANHQEMTDTELTRVRLHLIDCDRCRMSAVPEHYKKRMAELWPEAHVPGAEVSFSRTLFATGLVVSLLLHLVVAVLTVGWLEAEPSGPSGSLRISSRLQGSAASPREAPPGSRGPGGSVPLPEGNGAGAGGAWLDEPIGLLPEDGRDIGIDRIGGEEPDFHWAVEPRLPFESGEVWVDPELGGPIVDSGGLTVREYEDDLLETVLAGDLAGGRLLVVWLIDRSPSMLARREQVIRRIQHSHDLLDRAGQGRLRMTVVGFGREPERAFFSETGELEPVLEAIRNMEPDRSGIENTAAALRFCSRIRLGGGATRIILFTDEAGDDLDDKALGALTATLQAKATRSRLYVVCDEAPFGAVRAERPAGDLRRPAPASAEREVLADWGQAIPVLSAEPIGAGAGPYELALLADRSGGRLYLSELHTAYTPHDLAAVAPERIERRLYRERNRASRYRTDLLRAVRDLSAVEFPTRTVLHNDQEVAGELATTRQAQAKVRQWLPVIRKATEEPPSERRWRANGELLLAQLTVAAYYLEIRAEQLAAAEQMKPGERLVFALRSKPLLGAREVRLPALAVARRYPFTPWGRIGRRLSRLKTLTLLPKAAEPARTPGAETP